MIDEGAVNAWVNNPNGEIAQILKGVAEAKVIPAVRKDLSQPAIYARTGERGWLNWVENKPPGPPRMRLGRLRDSLAVGRAHRDALGLRVDIVAVPEGEFDYVDLLINGDGTERHPGGYVFVIIGNPHFDIVPRQAGQ